jgi:biotin synthase-like enzyme
MNDEATPRRVKFRTKHRASSLSTPFQNQLFKLKKKHRQEFMLSQIIFEKSLNIGTGSYFLPILFPNSIWVIPSGPAWSRVS